MTQTLIEQLEALHSKYEDESCNAYYMADDLRAIIEQHKSDMGVNLQLQIAPTVLLSKDFFRLSKGDGVLIQSWLNSAYEQIADQHKSEAVEPVAVLALKNTELSNRVDVLKKRIADLLAVIAKKDDALKISAAVFSGEISDKSGMIKSLELLREALALQPEDIK